MYGNKGSEGSFIYRASISFGTIQIDAVENDPSAEWNKVRYRIQVMTPHTDTEQENVDRSYYRSNQEDGDPLGSFKPIAREDLPFEIDQDLPKVLREIQVATNYL